jgi:hypothetical protein
MAAPTATHFCVPKSGTFQSFSFISVTYRDFQLVLQLEWTPPVPIIVTRDRRGVSESSEQAKASRVNFQRVMMAKVALPNGRASDINAID